MKKIFSIVSFVTLLFLCSCQPKQSEDSLPLADIRSKSVKAPPVIDVGELANKQKLTPVDSVFFAHYLNGLAYDGEWNGKLAFNPEDHWYFYDFRSTQRDQTVFSLLRFNTDYFYELYYFIYDNKQHRIVSVNLVGVTSGDGESSESSDGNTRLTWLSDTTIRANVIVHSRKQLSDTLVINGYDSNASIYTLRDSVFINTPLFKTSKSDTVLISVQ